MEGQESVHDGRVVGRLYAQMIQNLEGKNYLLSVVFTRITLGVRQRSDFHPEVYIPR